MTNMTLDVKELRARWAKLYINIHMLQSKDPRTMAVLEPFKLRISMFNEEMMAFISKLEEPQEPENLRC